MARRKKIKTKAATRAKAKTSAKVEIDKSKKREPLRSGLSNLTRVNMTLPDVPTLPEPETNLAPIEAPPVPREAAPEPSVVEKAPAGASEARSEDEAAQPPIKVDRQRRRSR